MISIHASHAGCDFSIAVILCNLINFNPRIPCGMRPWSVMGFFIPLRFQSTHPMRDATSSVSKVLSNFFLFQSTHPMRDATKIRAKLVLMTTISIHASHAGCDIPFLVRVSPLKNFNPRIPCGMRPEARRNKVTYKQISIHASHAGCDDLSNTRIYDRILISIHASHAGCDVHITQVI